MKRNFQTNRAGWFLLLLALCSSAMDGVIAASLPGAQVPKLAWKAEADGSAGLSAQSAQVDALESGFAQPPLSARPLTWWHWINGNVTKEGIEADLTEMKKAGLGGVQMLDVSIYLPPGPVRYGSDLWHEHVQHAIRTANKLGLEFHIMNCPGWSASGGPWNKPEGSMKQFTWSETEVDGGRPVDVVLPLPPWKLGFYRDVAVIAVPAASKTTAPAEELKAAPQLRAVIPYALSTSAHAVSMEKVLVFSGLPAFEGQFRCDLPGREVDAPPFRVHQHRQQESSCGPGRPRP